MHQDQDDWAPLTAALDRFTRVSLRAGMPQSLSLSGLGVLGRLRGGPCRITDLAEYEHISQPAATTLVNRLERQGLLARGSDPEDGRVVLVRLTEAGAELLARRAAERSHRVSSLIARMSPADAEALRQAMPALSRLAELYEATAFGDAAGSVDSGSVAGSETEPGRSQHP